MNSKPSSNLVALICVAMACGLAVYIFQESRYDPGLRIAALVAATGVVATLSAIASLLLTGKDLTAHRDPSDLPPGSTQNDSTLIQTSTVTPPASNSTTEVKT